MKTRTQQALSAYIEGRIQRYVRVFDCLPDIIILSQEDYDLIKDYPFVKTLRVIIEHVDYPIVIKR